MLPSPINSDDDDDPDYVHPCPCTKEEELELEENERWRLELREEDRRLYGLEGEEPAVYLKKPLFKSCAKFFDKALWIQLAEGWHVERYTGFHSEQAIDDCYNAYARYLLRGFKAHPNWNASDEAVSKTTAREAWAAKCYKIWGFYEECADCWEPREVPIEGGMHGMTLRSGKRCRLAMPTYPGIEEHAWE